MHYQIMNSVSESNFEVSNLHNFAALPHLPFDKIKLHHVLKEEGYAKLQLAEWNHQKVVIKSYTRPSLQCLSLKQLYLGYDSIFGP